MLSSIKRIYEYCFSSNDKIGSGCSSEVYLGLHQKTRQQVAIKIISKTEHNKLENIAIAENQIRYLHYFKGSPHILQLLHASHTKNNIYIISELCQLGTLADLLKHKGKLNEEHAQRCLLQIIKGYGCLAHKNIIHRDLKTMNIFVKKPEVLVIGDFGFSVQLRNDQETFRGTAGSPYYMAPQVLFDNIHSTKSDIWAIGIIFLQMLLGSNPWKSKTEEQLMYQVQRFDLANYIPQNLSKVSKDFLKKSLAKDVQNRMTVEQLLSFWQIREKGAASQEIKPEVVKIQKSNISHNLTKANSISTDGSDKSVTFEQMNQFTVTSSRFPSSNTQTTKAQAKCKNLQVSQIQSLQQSPKTPEQGQKFKYQKVTGETCSPATFFNPNKESKKKQQKQGAQSNSPKVNLVNQQIICQIEAQVNYFRFVFKLYKKMKEIIKVKDANINSFKQHLLQLTFNVLNQTKNTRHITGIPQEKLQQFKASEHFKEAMNVLEQYKERYQRQQQKDQIVCSFRGEKYFMKLLTHVLEILYQNVLLIENNQNELNRKKGLVFLIQDLIKLAEVFLISKESNWRVFSRKSSLREKLEQVWPQSINAQYWGKIKEKYNRNVRSEHSLITI